VTGHFSLDDEIVVVAGGAGLVGDAICRVVHNQGATVVVADADEEGARTTAASLDDATPIAVDTTDEAAVEALFETVAEKHGSVDAVVNTTYPRTENYGRDFRDVDYEDWRTNVGLHLNSYYLVASTAARRWLGANKPGNIVNLASIYGIQAPDFTLYENFQFTSPVEYSAIKGGILNLTRYLAAYLGPSGIRVNAVSPGGVFDDHSEEFVERYVQRTPLGRMAEPEDVACAVAYLLSGGAGYVTGENLVVDGGWTIS